MPQFTLKALLMTVGFASLALASFRLCYILGRYGQGGIWQVWLLVLSGLGGAASLGAAVGTPFHQKRRCAVTVLVFTVIVALILPAIR